MKKEIVILTMSSKNKNYCVAGLDVDSGEWIRLVSNDVKSHGALSRNDVLYRNKAPCQPLDIVRVSVIGDCPIEYQPENVLIDTAKYWEKAGEMDIGTLLETYDVDTPSYILGSSAPYVIEEDMSQIGHSLVMVEVHNLRINHPGEHSTKARFTYNGVSYSNMSVTDPDFYVDTDFHFDRALLIVSLPDASFKVNGEDRYYKFVAKIFPL